MTQTVVNFITGSTPVSGILPSEYRVFDFEITESSYQYYKEQLQLFKDAYRASSGTQEEVRLGLNALIALNQWSGYKYVDTTTGAQLTRANATDPLSSSSDLVYFVPPATPGIDPLTSTMDKFMAQSLLNITRTLAAGGFDVNTAVPNLVPNTISPSQTAFLAALVTVGVHSIPGGGVQDTFKVGSLIDAAFNAVEKSKRIDDPTTDPVILRNRLLATSEQQMLQVDYVSRGNEILFNQMDQLNQALTLNDTALGFLNSLQDLMNQKDPDKFVLQLQFLSMTSLNYKDYETQTFTNPLGTVARFADSNLQTYINPAGQEVQFASQAFKNDLFDTSSTAFTATKAKLLSNLDLLATKVGEASGGTATRLVNAITKIRSDINTVTSIQTWVQDTTTGQEGDYQRHVNDALVASQSFNDTQREELRRVMFVFEEFYKSATALLSQLGSLIDKGFSYIGR